MASTNEKDQMLEIGARVFYPGHGVAVVMGVEERDFGASPQLFYALELQGGQKVMVPVSNVDRAGVRDLVSVASARKLLKQVAQTPGGSENASRRLRVANYKEGLRTGVAERYTSILQRLLYRSRSRKLANDERSVLEEARRYFVAEIGAVLDLSRSEVADVLTSPATS